MENTYRKCMFTGSLAAWIQRDFCRCCWFLFLPVTGITGPSSDFYVNFLPVTPGSKNSNPKPVCGAGMIKFLAETFSLPGAQLSCLCPYMCFLSPFFSWTVWPLDGWSISFTAQTPRDTMSTPMPSPTVTEPPQSLAALAISVPICFRILGISLESQFLGRLIRSPGVPKEKRGLEFSRRKKGQTFFPSTFLRII